MKWMKGSDYEGQVCQWVNDMGGMSNHEKRQNEFKRKRIGVNHNSWHKWTRRGGGCSEQIGWSST